MFPMQEGTVPFRGRETWYRVVGDSIFEESSHMAFAEVPERNMDVLDDFLSEVVSRAAVAS